MTPTVPGNPDTNLQLVGRAAANELLETIRDGDVIAITGGKAMSAVVANLAPDRTFDVTVVPLTGGVQGKYYTDVNHLATQLADRLGGSAMLLHAPLFAESREQRNTLMEVGSIRQVLDLARRAQVALVGIGSILTPGSSYYDLVPAAQSGARTAAQRGRVRRVPRPPHPRRRIGGRLSAQLAARGAQSGRARRSARTRSAWRPGRRRSSPFGPRWPVA